MSYATIADARAEGVTTDAASDPRLQAALDAASEYVDAITGWWFEPRVFTSDAPLCLDGNGTPHLRLPAPPITLVSLTVDGDGVINPAEYIVQGNARTDRREVRNPRITRGPRSARYIDRVTWPRGVSNIALVGTFGFTNPDGVTAPAEIRAVTIRLALRRIALATDASAASDLRRGELVEEHSDGHSYKLQGAVGGVNPGAWRTRLTGDPSIDPVLLAWTDVRPHGGHVA